MKFASVNPLARTITSRALKDFAKVFAVITPVDFHALNSSAGKQVGVPLIELHQPTQAALGRVPDGGGNAVAVAGAFHSVKYQSIEQAGITANGVKNCQEPLIKISSVI